MRKILIIGVGAGHPEHITIQAINAINRADVLFIIDKGPEKDDLAQLRRDICARYAPQKQLRTVPKIGRASCRERVYCVV